ncbi:hypothetical protein FHW12_001013 [Dokdonella fugitiva]|uniref:Uncharacterized protein n=1 Tax=Dokdonella fugitiva TaxID=328517 RepID=A0A839EYK9_9GAMM|nr:hypothetical protein [Dokdonella fugitiva]MBA8886822.1 hypothetical protein [Dokdonella fugitiva]
MELVALLNSLKPEELRFIAALDYGQDEEQHFQALSTVIERGGRFVQGEHWHPYEVVELGAHALVPGHEREFAACALLVIAAVASGFDLSTDLADKFDNLAEAYGNLAPPLRESILSAYVAAGL